MTKSGATTTKKAKKVKVIKTAPCHFCEKPVDKADYYCSGCEHIVCDDCDTQHPMGHGHSVDEHQ